MLATNASLPQKRFSSHTKEDIVQALELFFGKPNYPEKLANYSDHQVTTFHFPDAFLGSNVKLAETLSNLINEPTNWQTTDIFPLRAIDGVQVEWDEIHFDLNIMQRVPYEGTSRMQTVKRTSHRDRMVRRGLGLLIESDFYRTPQGQSFFLQQIQSIRQCVQETANYDVLYKLLTCHNYDFHYDMSKGLRPHRNIMAAMQKEVDMYCCLQLNDRGLDVMIEKGKQWMARYNVNPTALIIPPEMELYVTMAPQEKKMAYIGGETAVAEYVSTAPTLSKASARGLNVYVSQPHDSGDNTDSQQMLLRNVQVGEFYTMRAPSYVDPKHGLTTDYMDIFVYSESSDQIERIHFETAYKFAMCALMNDASIKTGNDDLDIQKHFKDDNSFAQSAKSKLTACLMAALNRGTTLEEFVFNTGLGGGESSAQFDFDAASRLALREELEALEREIVEVQSTQPDDEESLAAIQSRFSILQAQFRQKQQEMEKMERLAGASHAADDAASSALQTQKAHRIAEAIMGKFAVFNVKDPKDHNLILNLVRLGIWVPINLTIARPFIEHQMYSAVMMVAGSATGSTLFGPSDMQISANTTNKTIEGHYTCHMNVVVMQPKNVMVLRDALCAKYVAGCNTLFFGEDRSTFLPDIDKDAEWKTIASKVRGDVRTRLDMDDEYANNYRSMMAFASSWWHMNDGLQNDNAFSIGSSALPWEIGMGSSADNRNFPGGQKMYDVYSRFYGLQYVQTGVNPVSAQRNDYLRNGPYNNTVCIQGPYRTRNPDNTFTFYPGKGHLGSDALPGDAKWRRGEVVTAQEARRQVTIDPSISFVEPRLSKLI